MAAYRSIKEFDWGLLLIALLVSAIGVLQIFSAGQGTKWKDLWWKQIIFVCFGLVLMWIISSIDYHTLLGQVPILYGATILLLIVTALFGVKIFESRRWLALPGGFLFQISEFAKLVMVLVVARFLTDLRTLLRTSFEISTSRPDGPATSLPLHRAVLDAVIARNPVKAERASQVLIDGAREDIDQVLASRRKLPSVATPAQRWTPRRPVV